MSGEYYLCTNWLWTGAGDSLVYNLGVSGTIGSDKSFSLISKDSSKVLPLVNNASLLGGVVNVAQTNGTYSATVQPFSYALPQTIELGVAPEFRFSFSDGTKSYFTYELTQLASASSYSLHNADTGMLISFQSTATPSSVPLPGAAWLFGSSLLGLLGIGNRKSKA